MIRSIRLAGVCISAILASGCVSSTSSSEPTLDELMAQVGWKQTDDRRWYVPEEPVPNNIESVKFSIDPLILYKHSLNLYEAGEKADAGYWYYLADIRSRVVIDCSGLGPWNNFYDRRVAIRHDLGPSVNGWLGGDLQLWLDSIHAVQSDYGLDNETFVDAKTCEAHISEALDQYDLAQSYIVEEQDDMRQQRAEAGLENRTTSRVVRR